MKTLLLFLRQYWRWRQLALPIFDAIRMARYSAANYRRGRRVRML